MHFVVILSVGGGFSLFLYVFWLTVILSFLLRFFSGQLFLCMQYCVRLMQEEISYNFYSNSISGKRGSVNGRLIFYDCQLLVFFETKGA